MTHFDRFTEVARPLLDRYGYGAIFALVFVENLGLPVPGETLFISAVFLAAKDELNLAAVVACAWLGSVLGGFVGLVIGRTGGHVLLARYGPYLGLTAARRERAETFVRHYGALVVVAARFFEGLRQMFALLAGIAGMSVRQFAACNVIGATLWVGLWTTLIFWFGRHTGYLLATFKRHELAVAAVALAVLCAVLAWRRFERRSALRNRGPSVAAPWPNPDQPGRVDPGSASAAPQSAFNPPPSPASSPTRPESEPKSG